MEHFTESSYHEWVTLAQEHECEHAKTRIRNGENVQLVLEDMSMRLMNKLLNPMYKIIKDSVVVQRDYEELKQKYKENYLDKCRLNKFDSSH